jgi:hypothetical protein
MPESTSTKHHQMIVCVWCSSSCAADSIAFFAVLTNPYLLCAVQIHPRIICMDEDNNGRRRGKRFEWSGAISLVRHCTVATVTSPCHCASTDTSSAFVVPPPPLCDAFWLRYGCWLLLAVVIWVVIGSVGIVSLSCHELRHNPSTAFAVGTNELLSSRRVQRSIVCRWLRLSWCRCL